MFIIAIVVGGLGAIIGLIAYGVFSLCYEADHKPPKKNYSCYTESEKDKLLEIKDRTIADLTYNAMRKSSDHDDISKEIAKGIRDGIARSQFEHGEDIRNYGISDVWFK